MYAQFKKSATQYQDITIYTMSVCRLKKLKRIIRFVRAGRQKNLFFFFFSYLELWPSVGLQPEDRDDEAIWSETFYGGF